MAELDPLDNLVLPEAMGLGNCCYHRMELSLQSSVEVAPDILKKAKQVVQQTPVPTEPFALEEDARVAPVQLKHVAQSDHLDGLIRNRADPREKMDAFGAWLAVYVLAHEANKVANAPQQLACIKTFRLESWARDSRRIERDSWLVHRAT